ncbi:SapB/AmfS family lanthipeptide [Streptomyces sp. NPDC092952]
MNAILELQNLELPEGPNEDGVADGLSSISLAFCTGGGGGTATDV